jgi:hypothetical protein
LFTNLSNSYSNDMLMVKLSGFPDMHWRDLFTSTRRQVVHYYLVFKHFLQKGPCNSTQFKTICRSTWREEVIIYVLHSFKCYLNENLDLIIIFCTLLHIFFYLKRGKDIRISEYALAGSFHVFKEASCTLLSCIQALFTKRAM